MYFTMSIGYQNDDFQKTRRQKRFTDSITVSVNSSVFVYHACYQVQNTASSTYFKVFFSVLMQLHVTDVSLHYHFNNCTITVLSLHSTPKSTLHQQHRHQYAKPITTLSKSSQQHLCQYLNQHFRQHICQHNMYLNIYANNDANI